MFAPSRRISASTYGIGIEPENGTFTMQNVVTVPVSATGTSSFVGTPHRGHAPERGGTYTFEQRGHRCPTIRPCSMFRRNRDIAIPGVYWYSSRTGDVIIVTGSVTSGLLLEALDVGDEPLPLLAPPGPHAHPGLHPRFLRVDQVQHRGVGAVELDESPRERL